MYYNLTCDLLQGIYIYSYISVSPCAREWWCMYRFKWPLCKKIALLVLVWCYKARIDREQDLWMYRLSEGCIKQWYDKSSDCGSLSKECEQWEQWSVNRGSNEVWTGGAMKFEQGSNEVWTGGAMYCEQWGQCSVSRGGNVVWAGGAMKCEQREQWSVSSGGNEVWAWGAMKQ